MENASAYERLPMKGTSSRNFEKSIKKKFA